jgi:hypothetical protein
MSNELLRDDLDNRFNNIDSILVDIYNKIVANSNTDNKESEVLKNE